MSGLPSLITATRPTDCWESSCRHSSSAISSNWTSASSTIARRPPSLNDPTGVSAGEYRQPWTRSAAARDRLVEGDTVDHPHHTGDPLGEPAHHRLLALEADA